MLSAALFGALLLAMTVVVHMVGMVALFRWVLEAYARGSLNFLAVTWLLIRLAWALVGVHLLEIAVWALFYWSRECLPDLESSFHFSGVTYATVGYGDVVLESRWRLLGPIQGLTGILMCGLSTGFFFATVAKLYSSPPAGASVR